MGGLEYGGVEKMPRITEQLIKSTFLSDIQRHRDSVTKFGRQVSSGFKVEEPGDSSRASTVANFRDGLTRIDGYRNVLAATESFLSFQDTTLTEAQNLLVRAKEVATQGANETLGVAQRQALAEEIFQIRDQFVRLANSSWLGKYVWNGSIENQPPFNQLTYTDPATGEGSQRWSFNNQLGSASVRSVAIGEGVEINVNSPGNQIFENGISALERLGRALDGYFTNPPTGVPDGTGAGMTFPTDFQTQSADIRSAIDLIETARTDDIEVERVNIGARLNRVDTVRSLLSLAETNSKESLSELQDADIAESASNLSQAQTALEASYIMSNRFQQLSILNYL